MQKNYKEFTEGEALLTLLQLFPREAISTMEEVKQAVDKARETSSPLEKVEALSQIKSRSGIALLKVIVTESIVFNLLSESISEENYEPSAIDPELKNPLAIFPKLYQKSLEGTARSNFYYQRLSLPEHLQEFYEQCLNKDFRAGFSEATVNKAFPGLIKIFSTQLIETWEPGHKFFNPRIYKDGTNEWVFERKYDGQRALIYCQRNLGDWTIKTYTRAGRIVETNQEIEEIIKSSLTSKGTDPLYYPGFWLDGEICKFSDSTEDFLALSQEVRRKDQQMSGQTLVIFDLILDSGEDRLLFDRQSALKAFVNLFNSQQIRFTEQIQVPPEFYQEGFDADGFVIRERDKAIAQGWEGLVLKRNAPRRDSRSWDWLRCKTSYSTELPVLRTVSTIMQTSPGFEETVLGSVIVDYKGRELGVGSGFTVEQRREFQANPSLIVGHKITVEYAEESKDMEGNLSLRFPVFKAIRDIVE